MAKEDDSSLSTNVLKIVRALKIAGWIGFWAQSVLAVISTLILLFAIVTRNAGNSEQSNPGTGVGLFLAFLGLVAVYVSIFWSYRYTLLAKKLRLSDNRPTRADTIKQLKIGIIIGFVGMFVTLLGAEAIVGVLVAKSLSQPQTAFVNAESFNRLVQPIDIFVVQANTNTILAHFLGLVTSVWLLDRISK